MSLREREREGITEVPTICIRAGTTMAMLTQRGGQGFWKPYADCNLTLEAAGPCASLQFMQDLIGMSFNVLT